MTNKRFITYTWITLVVTMIVILWGDVVQATGSGDGCGAYWPVCNGEVLPAFEGRETIIEYTHRATSGIVFLMAAALLIWSRRSFEKGSLVRRSANYSMFFMVTESLVGAALVLFRLVGEDASLARAFIAPIHLLNTLLLIASIVFILYFAYGGKRFQWQNNRLSWLLALGIAGIMIISTTGAITSLGDAIFPVTSTGEAIQQSQTAGQHFLVRLRVWHPVTAIIWGIYLAVVAYLVARARPSRYTNILAYSVLALFISQLIVGTLNVVLNAILPTQIIHLLLADALWSAWVLLCAFALSQASTASQVPTKAVVQASVTD